jgi:hypothetical protein
MRKKLMNSLNPKEKEVKKMKKLVFFALVAIFIVALAGVGMADVINPGPFGAKYIDQSYTSSDYPGGPPTGPIWGVVSLTGTYNLIDGNPESQNLAGVAYYTPGSDGYYYFGVYGGLAPISTAGATTYLGAATGQTPYLKIYAVPVADGDVYSTAVIAGPGVGDGAFGTFGSAIINAVGAVLFLDLAPPTGDYMATYQPTPGAPPGTVETFTISGATTGHTLSYWDVIGGSGADLIAQESFPFIPNPYYNGAVIDDADADLKIVSDLTGEVSPFGWVTSSEDPVTGIGTTIPEPSTILLLGAGLFGIGIFGRKRMKG